MANTKELFKEGDKCTLCSEGTLALSSSGQNLVCSKCGRTQNMEGKDQEQSLTKVIAEYSQAQGIGLHTDSVIYEVTSIVWGANTLLLGFILEVDCKSRNQKLVLAVSAVRLLMSLYVPWVYWLRRLAEMARHRSLALTQPMKPTVVEEKRPRPAPRLRRE